MSVYKEQSPKVPARILLRARILERLIQFLTEHSIHENSKAVAFAVDLILAVRNETIKAAENISNIEMSKIAGWSMNNKINFNENKSKVMIISRRKRNENK